MKPAPTKRRFRAKKVTRITLSMDVYLAAKQFGINISRSCEQRLREEIEARSEQQWNEEHAHFLEAYNKRLIEEGPALLEWRQF